MPSFSTSLPPTSALPPIQHIKSSDPSLLKEAINYLRSIYNPPVRGTRRIGYRHVYGQHILHTLPHTPIIPNALASFASDTFERAHTLRWLTALTTSETIPEDIVDEAAALLAACAGTASAGVVTRSYSFGADEDGTPILITLADAPLDNDDYASVGAQTWGGACVLANLFADAPGTLLPTPSSRSPPLRICELGAGTGLVGFALMRILQARAQPARLVATDFYPGVLENLQRNAEANFPSNSEEPLAHGDSGVHTPKLVSVEYLDWAELAGQNEKEEGNTLGLAESLGAPFDILLGADIVYELPHARWLHDCAARLLRHPRTNNHGMYPSRFHLLVPRRATHLQEVNAIEQVFASVREDQMGDENEGVHLKIVSKNIVVCEANQGEDEVVEYEYYQIGWS